MCQTLRLKWFGRKNTCPQEIYSPVRSLFNIVLVSVSYSLRYGAGAEWDEKRNYYKMEFRHNLSFSASIGLGSGWKASTSLSYDVNAKKLAYSSINVSRDLHCWSMSASFVPFGPYKSYTFHIGVNASMLKDLKYDKSSADATGKRVNWW